MKVFKLIAGVLTWLLTATPVLAGGSDSATEPFEPIDAQALIDACWDMTDQQRLGSTVDTRDGIFDSVICLEKRILDQFDALFPPSVLSREVAAKELETTRQTYTNLYWHIYNENKGCRICPTQYYSSDLIAWSRVLERMLSDAAEQRNRYKL
jgi:hypothetical protein